MRPESLHKIEPSRSKSCNSYAGNIAPGIAPLKLSVPGRNSVTPMREILRPESLHKIKRFRKFWRPESLIKITNLVTHGRRCYTIILYMLLIQTMILLQNNVMLSELLDRFQIIGTMND